MWQTDRQTNLRVQPDEQQHQEEETGPDRRTRQLEHGRRIGQKGQTRSRGGDLGDRLLLLMRHESHHWEDDEAREHAGAGVDGTNDESVSGTTAFVSKTGVSRFFGLSPEFSLVDVICEFVVAAQCHQRAQAQAVREENLSHGVDPHLKGRARFTRK